MSERASFRYSPQLRPSLEVLARPREEPPTFTLLWWRWVARWMAVEGANGIREASGSPTTDALPDMTTGRFLAMLTATGAAIAGLGFALEAEGFAGNALAGLSSLILGAVLAVVLIDHLLRRQRREHWSLARNEICRAICESVVDMASSFALFVSGGGGFLYLVGPEKDPVANPRIRAALGALLEAASADEARLSSALEPDLASSRVLYDQVAAAVAPLRVATTTRVIVLGDEPRLVTALLDLEHAERRWGSWVETVEREGAPDSIAWYHATATLRAGSEVYGYFLT